VRGADKVRKLYVGRKRHERLGGQVVIGGAKR